MNKVFDNLKLDEDLQIKYKRLCDEYSEIFSLGKFKDFELEAQFKKDTEP